MKVLQKAIFLLLISAFVLVISDTRHDQECQFWNQMASNLSSIDKYTMPFGTNVYMHCDGGCANITCSGNMKESVFGPASVDVDFCFGVQLNHCEDPVRMEYYMELPKQQISRKGNITHNDTYEFPVPSKLPLQTDAKMLLYVEMVPVNTSFIRFGIKAKLRMMISGRPTFPLQRTVFPETLIDIPVCPKDKSVLTSFQPPSVCTAPPPPTNRPTVSTPKPSGVKSRTYHKSCELGLSQCVERNEMCKGGHNDKSRNGVCECLPFAYFSSNSGFCEKKGSLPPTTHAIVTTLLPMLNTTVAPSVTQASTSKGKNLVPIIVGSVVSVIVILVVGIFVIIFLGRRRRVARYRDNQQLLSDDMMDEEDDPNVTM